MSKLPRLSFATTLLGGLGALHCGDASSTGPSESSGQAVSAVTFSGPIHPQASASLCLDVAGQGTANGTAVQLGTCSGQSSQEWSYNGTTLSVYGDKCLDVTGGSTTNGTKLQIWDCTAGNKNQMWTESGANLVWASDGQCLDVTNGVFANGTPIQSWVCYVGE